ncbi:YolD-like family protein [Bacillus sp. FSL W8-0445]|nr:MULTISPECIES: YolD-like family protein [Bacillus]MDP4165391.1 YolD-like family protein [Bacillota bacterium]MCC2132956.1 YolD-like family protein [Bacillus licheniformis]MCC2145347.1 YolD-like family protein [Bacillus licheniformis]MCC2160841.1 YolD-like family protein [Bacillus licheniformis]MCC2185762.1 YolD-like family protein [Bacillus licheniformis]
MMLPEHVELIKEYHEGLDKVKKPVLDEQKYDELNNKVIRDAMEENKLLQFFFYQISEEREDKRVDWTYPLY